jgi:hypothetical protein
MPLRLNVGLSRKIGESNYGSRGASVGIALELEADQVNNIGRLQGRIRQLFKIAEASVNEELHRSGQADAASNGNGHHRQRPARSATQSQVRAINAIADRQKVDVDGLLRNRFQADEAGDLSISDASSLIDELKSNGNGAGGRR